MSSSLDLTTDIFRLFNDEWALLTAGSISSYNAMTISWGQLGSLWGMPSAALNIATVFVKPIRHTFNFLEQQDIFTLCWFPKSYKKDLGILGTLSGKDTDKLAQTKLTPKALDQGVGYEQAHLTLVCKKIYSEQLKKEKIPADVVAKFYATEEPHYLYIGQILSMIKN